MHIAAAVKCPIALISVGHVHYRETGPYGAGHCAVEQRRITLGRSDFVPGAIEERDAVSAEQAFRAVEIALGGVQPMVDAPEIANVDYYVSGFAPDGCLQFYPQVHRALTERDLIRMAYRAMWIEHLNDQTNPAGESAAIERMLAHFELPDPAVLTGWSASHAAAFDALQEIAVRGTRITAALLECLNGGKPMTQAKQLVAELMAFDEEARIFAEVHPACRPLALMARFERDNLEGSDPKALAETTLRIYEACAARAGLVAEKLRRIAG